MTNLRYPGPKPFTSNEKALFFGREDEAEKLNSIICNNRITVLLGRSGYGKSSLIQAGVIPYFKMALQYEIIQVRFTGLTAPKQQVVSLIDQLKQELQKFVSPEEVFLGNLLEDHTPGLWQIFKSVQWKIRKEKKGVLFILDQFEEIFKFSADYFEFSNELGELVHNRMPDKFQAALVHKIETDENYYAGNKEAIEFIRTEIQTSFLIGIRSDRMFLLDELGASIPTIFNNRFRLEALSIKKLSRIIREPAMAEGEFLSQPFKFSDGLIQAIRKYLSTSGPEYKAYPTIEAFELQIICQYIEIGIIKRQLLMIQPSDQPLEADETMIADGFDNIIEDYYVSIIKNDQFDDFERLVTRFLIERKLVDQKTGNRICVDKTSILPFGITNDILDKILETRIVRKELNTVSGESFELSHDTLISAIQRASIGGKLSDLNDQITRYYNNAARRFKKPLFFWNTARLEKKLVDRHGNLVKLESKEFAGKPRIFENAMMLEKSGILNTDGAAGKELLVLNEVFQDAVIAKVNRSSKSRLTRYTIGFFAMGVLSGLIILLTVQSLRFSTSENALRLAITTAVRQNDDTRAMNLLLLFNDLYGIVRKSSDSVVKETLREKLVSQFGYLYLVGDSAGKDTLKSNEYDISRDDSFLLAVLNPSASIYGLQLSGLYNADIYDKDAKYKWSFPGIDCAALLDHQLFILRKDTLKTYFLDNVNREKHYPVRKWVMLSKSAVVREFLKNGPSLPQLEDLSFSSFTPLRHLDPDNLLVLYRVRIRRPVTASRRPTFLYTSPLESSNLLAVVNLRTGNLSSLQSISALSAGLSFSVDGLSFSGQGQFPKYYLPDSPSRSAVLTQDGYNNHYLEYANLRTPQPFYSRVGIPPAFFPVPSRVQFIHSNNVIVCNFNFQSIRTGFQAFNASTTIAADSIRVMNLSLTGQTGKAITITGGIRDLMQNSDNSLTAILYDGISIYDKDLNLICSQPCDPDSINILNDKTIYRDNSLLYIVHDSALKMVQVKKGQPPYAINLHSYITDFSYSVSGDSIFCTTSDYTLHILDKRLVELFACYNYKPFRRNRIRGTFVSSGDGDPWYIIRLNKKENQFHNIDPDTVSAWIGKNHTPPHLPDSLRHVYHFIGNDIVKELGNLFND